MLTISGYVGFQPGYREDAFECWEFKKFQIEFGYKVVSANDFEVIAEATIAGTPRKGVLKWRLAFWIKLICNLDYSCFFSRFRCAEDKIDGELTIAFVTKNVQFQFGGERTPLSNG